MKNIYEVNYRGLLQRVDPSFIHHREYAQRVRGIKYIGFDPNAGTMNFTVDSSSGNGAYDIVIRFTNWRRVLALKSSNAVQKARRLMNDDIKMHCSCPAFQYWGYNYIATRNKASRRPENRPPDIRNPQRRGTMCFTGDTKISLLNGTEVAIRDLVGLSEFWVYSYDSETGKIVPGRAHSCRKTISNAELVKVTLDNGESVRCTPDHKWMLRSGEYREAKDLKAGDSLMPLYRKYDSHLLPNYEEIYHPGLDSWDYTHYMSFERKRGYVVHHKNGKRDNRPEKLEMMRVKEHIDLHRSGIYAMIERTNKDPVHCLNRVNRMRVQGPRNLNGERHRKFRSDVTPEIIRIDFYSGLSIKDMVEKYSCDQRVIFDRLTKAGISTEEVSKILHRQRPKKCQICGKILKSGAGLSIHLSSVHHGTPVNHKVVSVVHLQETEDVYDFTVDKHHNFALSSGIFVHNCKHLDRVMRVFPFYNGELASAIKKVLDVVNKEAEKKAAVPTKDATPKERPAEGQPSPEEVESILSGANVFDILMELNS